MTTDDEEPIASARERLERGLDEYYCVRYYSSMTITVKGQVTIPQALRERFGLVPGTEVEFVPREDGLQVRPRRRGRKAPRAFDGWLAGAAGSARTKLTTDEWMTITRGED